jgi:hypothetical protein
MILSGRWLQSSSVPRYIQNLGGPAKQNLSLCLYREFFAIQEKTRVVSFSLFHTRERLQILDTSKHYILVTIDYEFRIDEIDVARNETEFHVGFIILV